VWSPSQVTSDGNQQVPSFDDDLRFHEAQMHSSILHLLVKLLKMPTAADPAWVTGRKYAEISKGIHERGYYELTLAVVTATSTTLLTPRAPKSLVSSWPRSAFTDHRPAGEQLPANGNPVCWYCVGGGADTNIGANVLTSVSKPQ
jgi:hypothetical protein